MGVTSFSDCCFLLMTEVYDVPDFYDVVMTTKYAEKATRR